MCVSFKEKEDGKVVTKIKAASNFVFEPVAQVVGRKNGYIVAVRMFPNNGDTYVLFPCPLGVILTVKKEDLTCYFKLLTIKWKSLF